MTPHKLTLALAMAVAATGSVLAEDAPPLTANIGVVSNYMWRGVTQSKNGAAVQGGLDYAIDGGLSLGTWVSNIDFKPDTPDPTVKYPNFEWDLYGGYANKIGDFGYNLTTTYYAYPDGKNNNFWELGASGSFDIITVGIAYTVEGQAKSGAITLPNGQVKNGALFRDGDLYYYGNLSFDLPAKFKLAGTLGHYDFTDFGSSADYTNWELSISKDAGNLGTFSFNYDQTDGGNKVVALDNDPKLWIGWKKTF